MTVCNCHNLPYPDCPNRIAAMNPPVHPVQTVDHKGGKCPQAVTLRAYEVYKELYGAQEALITGGCRGGFGTGELIAFLYAHSFPKAEWRRRVDEAFRGAEHL